MKQPLQSNLTVVNPDIVEVIVVLVVLRWSRTRPSVRVRLMGDHVKVR